MMSKITLGSAWGRSFRLALIAAMMLSILPDALREAAAQDQGNAEVALLSADELFDLVGPIALYPDELVAIVLPASTYPLDIVKASRYLAAYENDQNLKPDENWDSSILGLLNYPEVINMLNDDLDRTWQLGTAVVNQQEDVMDAIQAFRRQADEAGNLESDEQITVVHETEIIEVRSTSTEVIYVPTYNPSTVIVYSTNPYPWVYSPPYPYYYRPAAAFWTGMFVGAAINYGIGWRGRGRNEINISRDVNISGNTINKGGGNKWKPNRGGGQVGRPGNRPSAGARPGTGKRPSTGNRPSAGNRPAAGTRPKADKRTAQQPGKSLSKQVSRRDSGNLQQRKNRAGSGGSFSNYNRGQRATQDSRRGQQSRATRSTNRSSRNRGGGQRRRR